MTAFPPRGGDPEVLLEDPDFAVLYKPAGMHTVPGAPGKADGDGGVLAVWAFERYPEAALLEGRGKGEGGFLHRLDRETSGLVLMARTPAAFRSLAAAAAAGAFRKEYRLRAAPSPAGLPGSRPERTAPSGTDPELWAELLRSRGPSPAARGLFDLLVRARKAGCETAVEGCFRAYGPGAARVACAVPGAAPARGGKDWGQSIYRTGIAAACPPEDGLLDLSAALSRGFRHQVRAHLAWIGLPLLGDLLYGGAPAERLYLSARALEFPHPRTGAAVRAEL